MSCCFAPSRSKPAANSRPRRVASRSAALTPRYGRRLGVPVMGSILTSARRADNIRKQMFSHLARRAHAGRSTLAIHEADHQPVRHVERAIADAPRPGRARRGRGLGIDEGLMGVALLAGPANVIMQLARPGVGYGVMESRVESGRVDLHPIKRARTTFTYLAVATTGSDAQKDAFRRAVNRAHAQVYSTADSPVQYNAFDVDLQLWVGACLYKGAVDIYRIFIGELEGGDADRHYREGMALATTLQVPPERWPVDRAAFDRYWQESLAKVHIDDAVRNYLYPIAAGRVRAVALPRRMQGP